MSTATMLKTAILLAVLQLVLGANLREFSFVLLLHFVHYEKQNTKLTAPFSGKMKENNFRNFEADNGYSLYDKIDRSCSTCGLYRVAQKERMFFK